MKKLFKPFFAVLFVGLLSLSLTSDHQASIEHSGDKVYICNSEGAYAYHYNRNCRGLNNCKHTIIQVTKSEAYKRGKKKLCGWED